MGPTKTSFTLGVLGIYGLGLGLSQSLLSLGGTLAAAAGLFYALKALRGPSPLKGLSIASLCYILALLSGVLLRNSDRTSGRSLELIPLYLVPIGIAGLLSDLTSVQLKRVTALTDGLIKLSCAVAAGVGFYQVFGQGRPATGFFNNPIYFAYALFPIFLFYLWKLQVDEKRRHADAAMAGLLFLLICATQNRMVPFVALLATGYIGLFKLKHRPSLKTLTFMLVSVGLFMTLIYYASPTFREKIHRPFNTSDLSYFWRLKAWGFNWNLFKTHPVFGVGHLKNGIDTLVQTELAGHWQPGVLIYAHSVYLQCLAEAGVLGLVLLGFWLFQLSKFYAGIGFLIAFNFLMAGFTENITVNSKPLLSFLFIAGYFFSLADQSEPKKSQ